jgi:malate dehydrogenase (oxaloacetate-decarboxylating)
MVEHSSGQVHQRTATGEGPVRSMGSSPVSTPLRGAGLLNNPLLNKGRAFTDDERDLLGLRGLVPAGVLTIEQQMALELERLGRKGDDLERYIALAALHDRNETLFHRLLMDHPEELLPIVYTPTVGEACQEFSRTMRRPRGVWITPDDVDRIPQILRNSGRTAVRLVVATDNERILGLGDQGAGGMGIAIGKLALYSAGAGIHPASTLAVSLDVGTDNAELLGDPFYIGWRKRRLRGAPYLEVLDAFVSGLREVFPRAVLQWEDLKQHTAMEVLDRYRAEICSFNDDIQGTAAVTVAGILAALPITGEPLARQRAVFLGAGAAGIGITRLLRLAMQEAGVSESALRQAIVMADSSGLVFADRTPLDDDKRPFALGQAEMAAFGFPPARRYDLSTVIRHVRPSILVGTSGTPGSFTEEAIRTMAEHTPRPLVFPLSNPTSQAEATPAEILAWTGGRALVATGSPFDPVIHGGRRHVIGQANNVFAFPGIGLGLIAGEGREATDDLFLASARALAALVSPERLAEGALYPPLSELRPVSRAIAIEVARCARDREAGTEGDDRDIEAAVDASVWYPAYLPYRPA